MPDEYKRPETAVEIARELAETGRSLKAVGTSVAEADRTASAGLMEALQSAQSPAETLAAAARRLPSASLQEALRSARPASGILADELARTSITDHLRSIGHGQSLRGNVPQPKTGNRDELDIHSASDIGHAVRKARKARGLTQQEFADLAGVGRRFLSELEAGKPTLEIGKVLKVVAAAGIRLKLVAPGQTNE